MKLFMNATKEVCVIMARDCFEEYYHRCIKLLQHNIPEDDLTK